MKNLFVRLIPRHDPYCLSFSHRLIFSLLPSFSPYLPVTALRAWMDYLLKIHIGIDRTVVWFGIGIDHTVSVSILRSSHFLHRLCDPDRRKVERYAIKKKKPANAKFSKMKPIEYKAWAALPYIQLRKKIQNLDFHWTFTTFHQCLIRTWKNPKLTCLSKTIILWIGVYTSYDLTST